MRGRRPQAPQGSHPVRAYKDEEWVVLHNGKIVQIEAAGLLNCTVRVYVNESGLAVRYLNIPPANIKHTIPEDIAKAMLLLQGIEL